MMLTFGKKGHVYFDDENEFYFTLGFLAQSRKTEIHWEHNEEQGAWGSEGRIYCNGNVENYPLPLKRAFTAGTGGIKHRVNCNEYIERLVRSHHFDMGDSQDINSIRQTIPKQYLNDFNKGLKLIV